MKRRASTHNPLPQALDALFEVLLAEPDADARAAAHDAWHVTVDARLAATAITVKDVGPSLRVPFSAKDWTRLCDKFFEPTPVPAADIPPPPSGSATPGPSWASSSRATRKRSHASGASTPSVDAPVARRWVVCDDCGKWRQHDSTLSACATWCCSMNQARSSCSAPEAIEECTVANAPTASVDYEARCAAAAALALLAVKAMASDALARAAVSRAMTSPWAGTREAACSLLEALAAANRAAWRLPGDCIAPLSQILEPDSGGMSVEQPCAELRPLQRLLESACRGLLSAALALSNARGSDAVGAAAAAAEGLIAAISDDTAQPSRGTESAVRLAAATLRLAAEPATPSTGNAHRHSFDAPADAAAEAVVAWRGRALRVEEQLSSDTHTLQRRVRVAAAAALIAAEALPERLNTPLRALVSTLKQEPDSARRSVAARATARLVIRLLQTGAAPDDAGAAVRQSRAGAKLVSNLCNFIGAGPPQLNVPHSEDRSAGAALDGDNSERYRFAGACATLRACAVAADSENGGPSDARGQLFEVVYPLWERVDALSLAAAGNGALACARDSGAQRVAAAIELSRLVLALAPHLVGASLAHAATVLPEVRIANPLPFLSRS